MTVYACISKVSASIAKVGIAKGRKNQQQGYNFRGIDDVYNTLAPLLADAGLVIIPRILSRVVIERTSKSGTAQFYVTVEAEFDFIAAEDGSKVTARTYGEAQDSGDKATNKAMSAAYKYAAFQTFCIPTEGDNDADAHTPDPVVPTIMETTPLAPKPDGYEAWWGRAEFVGDNEGIAGLSALWASEDSHGFRTYTTTVNADKWAALKRQAEQVTAARAKGKA